MAIKSLDARSLMDEFLPHHDFKAAYELSVHAPSSVVCASLFFRLKRGRCRVVPSPEGADGRVPLAVRRAPLPVIQRIKHYASLP